MEDLEWLSLKLAEDLLEIEGNYTNLVISKAEEGDFRHLKKIMS